ncbi:hypothetical protein [Xanthobacter aminoxidans]|uniref:hypothetical protein n=1 Tax=Xanthobacter aminoxidans TaxID=186280 RepID=UPI0037299AF4
MDKREIDEKSLMAGQEYLIALKRLGLDPEALFWALDLIDDTWVLCLVTSYFDYAGPLRLSELIFKAYEASATPKEIDPFIIRLFGWKQKLASEIIDYMKNTQIKVRDYDEDTGTYGPEYLAQEKAEITMTLHNLAVPLNKIYVLREKGQNTVDVARKWRGITERVDRLAA